MPRLIRVMTQTDELLAELIAVTRQAHGMKPARMEGGSLVIEEDEVRKVVEVVEPIPEPPRPVVEVVEEKPVAKPVVETKPLPKRAGRPKGK